MVEMPWYHAYLTIAGDPLHLDAMENAPFFDGVGSRLLLGPTLTREQILRLGIGASVLVVGDLDRHEFVHIVVSQGWVDM